MRTTISQRKFLDSEEARHIKETLQRLEKDLTYNTEASYSATRGFEETKSVSFVDKHMQYLSEHPKLDPQQYLANLRLMTRVRR